MIDKSTGQFIYHDGKYWIVENQRDFAHGIGWFATPLLFKNNVVYCDHAEANWCYASNGAFYKKPEPNVMKQAYESYLLFLRDSRKLQTSYPNHDLTLINSWIKLFQSLLNKIPLLTEVAEQ